MNRYVLYCIIIGLLTSCYHEAAEKVVTPKRLLSEDSLVTVLTEVQLAEGALTFNRISHKKIKYDKDKYYAYIYRKYNLTPELLKENVDYYNSDPDRMVMIYDKVLARLSELQAVLSVELKKEEKAKEDSINSIDTTIYIRKVVIPYRNSSANQKFTW